MCLALDSFRLVTYNVNKFPEKLQNKPFEKLYYLAGFLWWIFGTKFSTL